MVRDRIWHFQQRYAPYLFLLPFFLLFIAFLLVPVLRSRPLHAVTHPVVGWLLLVAVTVLSA